MNVGMGGHCCSCQHACGEFPFPFCRAEQGHRALSFRTRVLLHIAREIKRWSGNNVNNSLKGVRDKFPILSGTKNRAAEIASFENGAVDAKFIA